MQSEKIKPADETQASLTRMGNTQEGLTFTGAYSVECYAADGSLKWADTIKNLVTTQGKNNILDDYFDLASEAGWYLGLVNNPATYAVADVLTSHVGWTENTEYSGNRKAPVWGSAAAGSKATTATSFAITGAGGTIAGAFMCTVATGTTGKLYSCGNFSGGSRTVVAGDTLNVTYTATAA